MFQILFQFSVLYERSPTPVGQTGYLSDRSPLRDVTDCRRKLNFDHFVDNTSSSSSSEEEEELEVFEDQTRSVICISDTSDENAKVRDEHSSFVAHNHLVDELIDITGITPSSDDDTRGVLSNCLNLGLVKSQSISEQRQDLHSPQKRRRLETSKSPDANILHPYVPEIENRLPSTFEGIGVSWSDRVTASLGHEGIILCDSFQEKTIFLSQKALLSVACTAGKFIATCTKSFTKTYPENFGTNHRYLYMYPGGWLKLKADAHSKRVFLFNENPKSSIGMIVLNLNALLKLYETCLQVHLYFPVHARIPCSWSHRTRHEYRLCKFCNVRSIDFD